MLSISFNNSDQSTAIISYRDSRKYQGIDRYYVGEIDWANIRPHGEGTVFFPQDSSKILYTGQWNNGAIDGKGTM